MSKKQWWADNGYLIPDTIDPADNICICVPVPNDPGHIRAFLAQIYLLTYWTTWQKNPEKTGKLAAARWMDIYQCVSQEVDCIMATGCGCGCGGERTITNQRYTENGHLEVSYDNGETWENADATDPRFNSPIFSPLPGADGETKRCKGANSVISILQDEQAKSTAILDAGTGITALLAAVAAAVAATGVGIVAAVVIAIMSGILNAIINAGESTFTGSFGGTTWDDLLCILFCEMEDDGTFTESGWASVVAQANALPNYPANEWLSHMIKVIGPVGLSNASLSGVAGSLSCAGCDCDAGCADKYVIGPISSPTNHGLIVARTGTTIDVQAQNPGPGGYIILQAETLGDCCYLNSIEALDGGTITANFHINCGTPYSESAWINGTPVGGCRQLIQIQTQTGKIFRFTFDECP